MAVTQSLPNILTFSRIAAIPLVVGFMYCSFPHADLVAAGIFMFACVTDYLDGYLARAWSQTSALGRFLDPIADKLLVAATLLTLVELERLRGWALIPALVILCREILVSGLREHLAELRVLVPVSKLSKWKTTLQMVSLMLLLINPRTLSWLPIHEIGLFALCLAAALTLVTGYDYLKASKRHFSMSE